MATFFIDYVELVRQAYEQKQANNTLPHGLMHLTPARLKEECIMRCSGNLNRRDEKAIRVFCGDLNESKTCRAIIQLCDTDKFKPLVNFLKGKSENTDPKNIELLAWLIDFPGRPWEMGKTYASDVNENRELTNVSPMENETATEGNFSIHPPANEAGTPAGVPTIPENPTIPIDNEVVKKNTGGNNTGMVMEQKPKRKFSKGLAPAVILSLVLAGGGAWWWKQKNQPPDLSGGCMYWKDDHYEPIACNQKIPRTMIIALDSMKLKNFKKITAPDTITYMALGKVWYSKIDGEIEYYTSSGVHPVVFGHRLKPITIYIIDKYIRPGVNAD